MLDSTLNKILTAGQTEPSIPPALDAEPKHDEMSSTEAEVRLVVRFIVEEHIVYRGKVERVHQLDSEELSRTVSRVLWTGQNECEDNSVQTKDHQIKEKSPQSDLLHDPAIPTDEQSSSKTTDPSQSNHIQTPPPANQDQMGYPVRELCAPVPMKASELESELDIEEIADVVDQDLADKICLQSIPESQNDCDTIQKPQESARSDDGFPDGELPEIAKSGDVEETKSVERSEELNIHERPGSSASTHDIVFDSTADSPSIIAALNDCVESVDISSRSGINIEDINDNLEETPVTYNNSSRVDDSATEPDTHLPVNAIGTTKGSLGPKAHVVPELSHEIVIEASLSKETVSDRKDESLSSFATELAKTNPTSKRKPNTDGSMPQKRVRRTSSKDQRSSKKRPKSNNPSENHTLINQDTNAKSMPPLGGEQLTRHSKIFAKWSDNHFYPGTILRPTRDRKIVVHFYDNAQKNVSETDIIPLCNIVGKQVRVTIGNDYCVNAVVNDQRSPINDQPAFDVEYKVPGQENVRKCVPWKDIFLTGEQGTPLIIQPDRSSGASNFADVDLDNIIYEKRSRRLQEMEELEASENAVTTSGKRRRGQHQQSRLSSPKLKIGDSNIPMSPHEPVLNQNRQSTDLSRESTGVESPDTPKTNPPSENSNSTGSSNIPSSVELGQEFYFTNSSPHRTNTSLLL